jgi:hypothetical protein
MDGFKRWLLLLESGRFDLDGFNAEFRRQLAELLPRVTDARRRASLEAMQDFDWVGYILAALRNAGFTDQQEREQAAHDLVVHLLVSPGQLFAGYDVDASGPMEARFRLSVQNAVRNLLRSRRRRREPITRAIAIGHGAGELPAEAIPDHRQPEVDDEVLAAFLPFLRREVGEEAVRLLTVKMEDELSQRELIRHPDFKHLGEWRIRRLMGQIRDAAKAFAERQGDEGFLAAINRLMASAKPQEEWVGWSSPWMCLTV